MKPLSSTQDSGRSGRALIVLIVLLGAGLAATGYWLGSRDARVETDPGIVRSSRPEAASPRETPQSRIEAPEREALIAEVRTPNKGPLNTPATEPERFADRLASPERNREIDEKMEERLERVRKLRRSENPEERLALAREILAENSNGPLLLHALQTMAELDPEAAAEEVRKRLEDKDGAPESAMMATVITMVGSNETALSNTDLAEFFEAGDESVQLAAARAMQGRGDSSLSDRFREERTAELQAEDPNVRANAVRHLASTRQEGTLPLLVNMLSDTSESVRIQALRAVTQTSRADEETLSAIRPLMQDSSERVRRSAERMVQSIERRMQIRQR